MRIITQILAERPITAPVTIEILRDRAFERCREDAEGASLYVANAIDNLAMFDEFEPSPDEVAEHLSPEDRGNWRRTVQVAATLAVRSFFEAQVSDDLSAIEAAIALAEREGYEVQGLHATCPYGLLPHVRETGLPAGTLFVWNGLSGSSTALALKVPLSLSEAIWLRLALEEKVRPGIAQHPIIHLTEPASVRAFLRSRPGRMESGGASST